MQKSEITPRSQRTGLIPIRGQCKLLNRIQETAPPKPVLMRVPLRDV
ncbi:hypothetical protein H1P_580013 [Hyella patelloides LEGE 07179]|uniref:Uncharacterized protein n=1 Tax=Hyella patelloides LEGE 07179 TaxID=945734 RepID=A0A563W0R8_9CYAN|nr:hypothetical protein H1P_580013 [Hyella patelloides LEGE 07179]